MLLSFYVCFSSIYHLLSLLTPIFILFAGMSHRTHMVHQLLVLHEAPAAEMASTGVPGDGAQVRGGRVA